MLQDPCVGIGLAYTVRDKHATLSFRRVISRPDWLIMFSTISRRVWKNRVSHCKAIVKCCITNSCQRWTRSTANPARHAASPSPAKGSAHSITET